MSKNSSIKTQKLIIYTDGGARGNPGPAAIAAIFRSSQDRNIGSPSTSLRVKEYAKATGESTNNVAEYKAVIFALKKAKQLFGKEKSSETEIEIRSDSELLVKQLNGEYKIKDKDLQLLFVEVWNLKQDFQKVEFVLIPREKNKAADRLVNSVLDKQSNLFNIRTS